jgi:prepilin-type N-terminal cleavage/methylation domain-containing protein
MKTKDSPSFFQEAFTIVELLVVVAVITVLAGLIAPALASSRNRDAAAGCLANSRKLQIVWSMYMADYNDVMLPNALLGTPISHCWVPPSVESWFSVDANTDTAIYANCLIAPYVNSNYSLLKCPADVVPSANGQRLRSYSMNSQMGASGIGLNYNPGYLLYTNGSDLVHPSPANAFIFVDEHPITLDDGFFQLALGTPSLPNIPASYLDGGCGFSFADGHAIVHMWQTSNLEIPVIQYVSEEGAILPLPAGNLDWMWLTNHGGYHN